MLKETELKAIKSAAAQLQERSYRAGLSTLEYLLEMVVVEADIEIKAIQKKRPRASVISISRNKARLCS